MKMRAHRRRKSAAAIGDAMVRRLIVGCVVRAFGNALRAAVRNVVHKSVIAHLEVERLIVECFPDSVLPCTSKSSAVLCSPQHTFLSDSY
jgi:hypothetical protein